MDRYTFDAPTCGHPWCINPEHQKTVGTGVLIHRRAMPRVERVAAALEAGQGYLEIARREGIHPNYVSQINTGIRMHGVREKYPIRPVRKRRPTRKF